MDELIIIVAIVGLAIQPLAMIYFFNKVLKRYDAERVDAYNRVPVDKEFTHTSSEFPREMFRQGESSGPLAQRDEPYDPILTTEDEFDLVGKIGPDTPLREDD